MVNPIVIVNVSLQVAPTPNTLQKTGAMISQGGTTITPGTYELLTAPGDLTQYLSAALSVTGIVQSAGTATATTAAPHGITTGDTFLTTIAGSTILAYNGLVLATASGASAFTYSLPSGTASPATGTFTYTPRGVDEIVSMTETFFSQGNGKSIYVLELGAGEPSAGVTELSTFIAASPQFFYAYLVPRSWDGVASYLTLVGTFEAPDKKTYFYTTTTTDTYTDYTLLMKSVFWLVQSPTAPLSEFTCAAPFFDELSYSPGVANKVSPFEYTFVFGVTPWPTKNNSVILAQLKAAKGNYIGDGAEGGISDAIVVGGTFADGNPVNYWYSIDWTQINVQLDVANAIINGSNDRINPLFFNQHGVDRLQQVGASTMGRGITFGLVLNPVVQTGLTPDELDQALDDGTYVNNTFINADPFADYVASNPGDYKIGQYAGFTIGYTPLRGFDQVIFQVNVSSFG